MRSALVLALILWAFPAAAADDAWSDADVEAAERYRVEERERAERYRAQVEAPRREATAPRARAEPRARSEGSRRGLGERITESFRGWLEGVLADLVRSVADAVRGALDELFGGSRPEAPRDRRGFGDWLGREQQRADDWLAGRPYAAPPGPESVREWQQREVERTREQAKRDEAEARERARRNVVL
jgi:hypothetical protein